MKNFLAAIALCSAVLLICSFVIVRSVGAGGAVGPNDEDIISILLQLPAPPAPNPLQKTIITKDRPATFYSKDNPPPDNAPIEDILDYWARQTYGQLAYNVVPTPVVLDRIAAAMEIDSTKITSYLNYLKDSPRGIAAVRTAYDRASSEPEGDPNKKSNFTNSNAYYGDAYYPNQNNNLKRWLIMNDPSFSADLEPLASAVKDTENGYIQNDDELLALAKNDWDRARPMIDKMYADGSQPASKTLATWALYRKAMDDGSLSDADKYRDELKGTVTNKQLSSGVRDLALDALSLNQEWSGRDDWYYSLMEDETLLDMDGYTGLTTLMTHSKPGKYKAKMIKLLQSNNPNVRSAAARNLGLEAAKGDTDAIAALLPWLENPEWIKDIANTRGNLVRALAEVKVPQSVPGLIAIMNERVENKAEDDDEYDYDGNFNSVLSTIRTANTAVRAIKNAANMAANRISLNI